MTALDRAAPTPRKLELDSVDLAIPAREAWELVRHGDLARSPLVRGLFALRTLPSRAVFRAPEAVTFRLDDMRSTPERPGFQILVDDAPNEVVVGAIGKVWQLDIPFVHVDGAGAFAAFDTPGYVKVAWAIRVSPRGGGSRVEVEVRVDATDEESWKKFRAYFLLIGPGSHFIRRSLLGWLAREHGATPSHEEARALVGDELLADAAEQVTQSVTIEARPDAIWPWLVQMGCRRGGFYSIDRLDNGGRPSAREIHPELQDIHVGDVLPASPESDDGFEVLRIDPQRALVLGGLFDGDAREQLPFSARRPASYWHVTWAFVLEPWGETATKLHVRARAAFPPDERVHAAWMRRVHHFMEAAQLRHLKSRVEGREPRDHASDVVSGVGGAAIMVAAFLTPFARGARSHWGLDEATATRALPGDSLVKSPRWGWTHAVEIDAPAAEVWPWVAQIGADRGGFYSYQWLENVAGCDVRNAEAIHPEWAVHDGASLSLHPRMPPLPIVELAAGKHFVALARADEGARAAGKPWIETSWLFLVEPLGPRRSRFVSRYRCACSDDLVTRLQFGAATIEPIGFAMDRRMLLGVKERVERGLAASQRTIGASNVAS